MKPKAVLAYCREKDIRAIDLRFADLGGDWKHITIPASSLTEHTFEMGFGQEVMLRGVDGEARQPAVLVPIAEAHFLDPVVEHPTLVILASILDGMTREESVLDSRSVAVRSVEYLQSTGIADTVSVRANQPFSLQIAQPENFDDSVPSSRLFLACNSHDEDFVFRCQLASLATEAGMIFDRHYRSEHSTSEIVLGSSGIPDLCDDLMMIRYLIERLAVQRGRRRIDTAAALTTQWTFARAGESIFSGSSPLGLSEMGWYAIGGILQHAAALSAVAMATPGRACDTEIRVSKSVHVSDPLALCGVILGHQDSRQRAIAYRGLPPDGNLYLQFASVLMAMIDGIQNKYPVSHSFRSRDDESTGTNSPSNGESMQWSIADLRQSLQQDSEFLLVDEVFSESLLQALAQNLEP